MLINFGLKKFFRILIPQYISDSEWSFKIDTYGFTLTPVSAVNTFFSSPFSRVVTGTIYRCLVGCCSMSNLFGKGEPNIGFLLPNKSDIGQAADQTTVLLFPPRMLILLVIRDYCFES